MFSFIFIWKRKKEKVNSCRNTKDTRSLTQLYYRNSNVKADIWKSIIFPWTTFLCPQNPVLSGKVASFLKGCSGAWQSPRCSACLPLEGYPEDLCCKNPQQRLQPFRSIFLLSEHLTCLLKALLLKGYLRITAYAPIVMLLEHPYGTVVPALTFARANWKDFVTGCERKCRHYPLLCYTIKLERLK